MRDISYIRSDYYSALADYGIKHSAAWEDTLSGAETDFTEQKGIHLNHSDIHGIGVFASEFFAPDAVICQTTDDDVKTLAGRFTNHSPYPNAKMVKVGLRLDLVAIKPIKTCDEITTDYRSNLGLHMTPPTVLPCEYARYGLERYNLNGTEAAIYDLLYNEDHIYHLSLVERIYAFEDFVSKMPQIELPVEHEFKGGMYKRTCTFPANTVATGKVHTTPHFDFLLEGEIVVATPKGFAHLKAPMTFTSEPGNKKAGFAITETKWATVCKTDCTTVEDVEKEIFQTDEENDAFDVKDFTIGDLI